MTKGLVVLLLICAFTAGAVANGAGVDAASSDRKVLKELRAIKTQDTKQTQLLNDIARYACRQAAGDSLAQRFVCDENY